MEERGFIVFATMLFGLGRVSTYTGIFVIGLITKTLEGGHRHSLLASYLSTSSRAQSWFIHSCLPACLPACPPACLYVCMLDDLLLLMSRFLLFVLFVLVVLVDANDFVVVVCVLAHCCPTQVWLQ